MTEQELTALAHRWKDWSDTRIGPDFAVGPLAQGYLTLLAERDALKERLGAQQTQIEGTLSNLDLDPDANKWADAHTKAIRDMRLLVGGEVEP